MQQEAEHEVQAPIDVKTVLDAGAALTRYIVPPISDGGIPYQVIPEGYKLESIEAFMRRPVRKRGCRELHDPTSFIAYVLAMTLNST